MRTRSSLTTDACSVLCCAHSKIMCMCFTLNMLCIGATGGKYTHEMHSAYHDIHTVPLFASGAFSMCTWHTQHTIHAHFHHLQTHPSLIACRLPTSPTLTSSSYLKRLPISILSTWYHQYKYIFQWTVQISYPNSIFRYVSIEFPYKRNLNQCKLEIKTHPKQKLKPKWRFASD